MAADARLPRPQALAFPSAPSSASVAAPPLLRPSSALLSNHSLEAIVSPVSGDMKEMNANLMRVVGERHPMLQAAAAQIFDAGGKKLRPVLCFLVARATAQCMGLRRVVRRASGKCPCVSPGLSRPPRSELTPEHRRLAEIVEMIHTASLVHDDVLDETALRRGGCPVARSLGKCLRLSAAPAQPNACARRVPPQQSHTAARPEWRPRRRPGWRPVRARPVDAF